MKDPIVITEGGDVVTHYPESNGLDDNQQLEGCFGVHLICGSFVDCKPTSCSASTILCRGCHLRVEIPLFISTTSELRKHFDRLQPSFGWEPPPAGTRLVCARPRYPFLLNDCGVIIDRPDQYKGIPRYLTPVKFEKLTEDIVWLRAGMIGPFGAFIVTAS